MANRSDRRWQNLNLSKGEKARASVEAPTRAEPIVARPRMIEVRSRPDIREQSYLCVADRDAGNVGRVHIRQVARGKTGGGDDLMAVGGGTGKTGRLRPGWPPRVASNLG
jgi:hypothetical protein